jgi:DNA-binding NarL/FixJ family response regulator
MSMNDASGHRSTIRVMVVDDHDLFRAGFAGLLAATDSLEVVAQAAGGKSAVRLATELEPDVILMDQKMPDLSGPDAMRLILRKHPQIRILALTVAASNGAVTAAMQAGACGFIVKDTPIEDVVAAVRAAARGAAWLSPDAANAVLAPLRQPGGGTERESELLAMLSPREHEVLRLVARGLDNAEIARALQISPRTAKNHVSSILEKLGLSNRIQAATWAVRGGLT